MKSTSQQQYMLFEYILFVLHNLSAHHMWCLIVYFASEWRRYNGAVEYRVMLQIGDVCAVAGRRPVVYPSSDPGYHWHPIVIVYTGV